jgi:hypothetical protein
MIKGEDNFRKLVISAVRIGHGVGSNGALRKSDFWEKLNRRDT